MTNFEVMGEDVAFPEGPVACDDGSVIVGEIRREQVTRVKPDGTKQHIAKIDGGPNGLAFGPDGALYCCNNGGFAWEAGNDWPIGVSPTYTSGSIDRINVSTGKVEKLYTACDGTKLAGPNDIVFDQTGGFWFTDLGKAFEHHELLGGLYYAKIDGSSIRRVAGGLDFNGVGLSPDGRTVYAAVTSRRWVLAFDAGPNPPANQGHGMIAGRIVISYPGRTLLDSMAIEADGTIAQATLLENQGVSRINPATGKETTVPFPDILTTNVAFGGRDMQTAYVTQSTTNKLLRLRWPAPGLRLPFNG